MKLVNVLALLLLGLWATARAEGSMGETCTFPIEPEVENAISPLNCGAQPCLDPGDGGGGGGSSPNPVCRIVCYIVCVPVRDVICTPVPPPLQPICRVIVYNECREVCERQCR